MIPVLCLKTFHGHLLNLHPGQVFSNLFSGDSCVLLESFLDFLLIFEVFFRALWSIKKSRGHLLLTLRFRLLEIFLFFEDAVSIRIILHILR